MNTKTQRITDHDTGLAFDVSEERLHDDIIYRVSGHSAAMNETFVRLGGRLVDEGRSWLFKGPVFIEGLFDILRGSPDPELHQLAEEATQFSFGHSSQDLVERFVAQGADAFNDAELLEVLLFGHLQSEAARDIAGQLMKRFGSLSAVLSAKPAELHDVSRLDVFTMVLLQASRTVSERAVRESLEEREILSSTGALRDYLKLRLRHETVEKLLLLFLDSKNGLIADETQQTGTVNHTPLYPREVVKRALELSASALIMVHNHPSGDPTPSRNDINMTRQVRDALKPLEIELHEHIIVGRNAMTCLIGENYI